MFWFIFQGLPVLCWAWLCWGFLRPLRLPRPWTLVAALALLLVSQESLWFRLFGDGDMFWPELPARLHFAISWGSVFFGTLFILSLLPPYRHGVRIRAAVLLALAAAIATYCMIEGARIPRVCVREVKLDNLPKELEGFRLVHLSDLHASTANDKRRFEEIVRLVNDLNPDLICITGDFVDGTPAQRRETIAPIAGFRARYGVYGCSGNHDHYSGYEGWRPLLAGFGIRMLDDDCAIVTVGSANIAVAGLIDSPWDLPPGHPRDGDRVARAFFNAPPKAFRMLLRHQPVGLPDASANGVSLQLSGHTHGGQIRPGLDVLVKSRNDGHVRGFYEEGGTTLFVSPGTGQWAGFPVRFLVPSEITLLQLHGK